MTTYNVVDRALMQTGQAEDISRVVANLDAIAAVINGNLDTANLKAAAGVLFSQLAGYPSDGSLFASGDGTWKAAGGSMPTGLIVPSFSIAVPTGFLACDGASQLRSSYTALFAAITASKGTFTVTIASPGVFTLAAHGLVVGDAVYLTTTGALPTGLTTNTTYYVSVVTDANTFQLSAARGGASINTSGAQSGVHTLVLAPAGIADSTHFNVPDLRGRVVVSKGTHADVDAIGEDDGLAVANRRPKHKHTIAITDPQHSHAGGAAAPVAGYAGGSSNALQSQQGTASAATGISATVGPQTGAEPTDTPAYIVIPYIIKT